MVSRVINIKRHQNSQCHEIRKFFIRQGRRVSCNTTANYKLRHYLVCGCCEFRPANEHCTCGIQVNDVQSFVCSSRRHAVRSYHCTRWRWIIGFTLRSLYSQGNNSLYPLNRRMDEPKKLYGRFGEGKNLFSCWESNHESSDVQPCLNFHYIILTQGIRKNLKPIPIIRLLKILKHGNRPFFYWQRYRFGAVVPRVCILFWV
jgi:hypothetical protein